MVDPKRFTQRNPLKEQVFLHTEEETISPFRQLLPAKNKSQEEKLTGYSGRSRQHIINTFLISAGAYVAYQYIFISETSNSTKVTLLVHRRRRAVVWRNQLIVNARHSCVCCNNIGPHLIHTKIVEAGWTQWLRNALFCRTTYITIGTTYISNLKCVTNRGIAVVN